MKQDTFTRWCAAFFVVSGFSSLVYEIVWLRLAMAAFGVNTALISIFLSLFMAGLGLGSWGAGALAGSLESRGAAADMKLYALAELLTAVGGFGVPWLFSWSHGALRSSAADWASGSYYLASAAFLAGSIVPFCVFMGATIPLAMSAIRKIAPARSEKSFSLLYLANVLGAGLGTLASAFVLIELFGFDGAGWFAAALNIALAAAAFALSARLPAGGAAKKQAASSPARRAPWTLSMLFATGFVGMAMEIVWTRQLIPYLGLHVYAFASILTVYLLAYQLGSLVYRRTGASRWKELAALCPAAAALGSIAMIAADPRWPLGSSLWAAGLRLLLIVAPLSFALGALTPMLVDELSQGDPASAGKGYAWNIVGCILGPLAASFALLPFTSERRSEAILLLAFCLIGYLAASRSGRAGRKGRDAWSALAAVSVLIVAAFSADFDVVFGNAIVLRDSTATLAATQSDGHKHLFINGISMTSEAVPTKIMAHFPLALLGRPPKNALVICFGMGTTFRSLLSWGIPATVVELVPSVPKVFGYFHPDGPELLASPRAKVAIDDGRRYLERSRDRFDLITLDPAPPIEGAANSLLYSAEFFALAKSHLAPGGIVQQWYWTPTVDNELLTSIVRSMSRSFRYVRVFRLDSPDGSAGFHLIGSDVDWPRVSPAVLAQRLPPAAVKDLLEWSPQFKNPKALFEALFSAEISTGYLLRNYPSAPALTDDRPLNEYYLLHRLARLMRRA